MEKIGINKDDAKLFDQTVGLKTIQEKRLNKYNDMEWNNILL